MSTASDRLYSDALEALFRQQQGKQWEDVTKAHQVYLRWQETGKIGDQKKFIARFYKVAEDDF